MFKEGDWLFAHGHFAKAAVSYSDALQPSPSLRSDEVFTGMLSRSSCYQALGDYNAALGDVRMAISVSENHPNMGEAYLRLAILDEQLGNPRTYEEYALAIQYLKDPGLIVAAKSRLQNVAKSMDDPPPLVADSDEESSSEKETAKKFGAQAANSSHANDNPPPLVSSDSEGDRSPRGDKKRRNVGRVPLVKDANSDDEPPGLVRDSSDEAPSPPSFDDLD